MTESKMKSNNAPQARKTYGQPELTELGKVEELTGLLNTGGAPNDMFGGDYGETDTPPGFS